MSVFVFHSVSGSWARRLFNVAIVLSILWLSGCGGSSGSTTGSNDGTISNQAPVATDDSAITNQATPVKIYVVANDTDPDGIVQTTGITIVSAPANGLGSANPDGTITYSPNANFTGPTDSFTYTVIDAQNKTSNIATVTVTINAIPVAVDDNDQTNQATPLIINVINNDNDPDAAVQADSITIVSMPTNGSATANANGTVTYTPNNAFTGPSDSFTYTITDAQNAVSNIATASIQVNANPVAVNDTALTVQATAVIIDVIANDTDSDGSIQANSVTVDTAPMYGNAIANANGTITYTPNASFTGPADSFTYTALDNQGGTSNIATVTVTINARPFAGDDSGLTNQATPITINVIANDTDPDGSIQVDSINIVVNPGNGIATANADGTVTYTPDGAFTGSTDWFTYTVVDSQNTISNVATVTININLVPLAPNNCSTTPQTTPLPGTLPGNDPDTSPGGLMFSLKADGSGGVGPMLTSTGKGTVEITDATTGAFIYTPNAHPSRRGTDTFAYRVEDTEGGVASGFITVIIDPKIMPLGDSITQGIEDSFTPALASRIGYRKTLYTSLTATGYRIDFVGSRSIGANLIDFDADVDGYAGAMDEEIAFGGTDSETAVAFVGIYDLLEANPADIVLLHIGANDLSLVIPDTSPDDVRSLLLEIDRWEDSANGNPVSVVLARTVDQCVNFPTDCGTGNPDVITYNNNVASMAAALIDTQPADSPDEIILVDQRTALLDGSNNPDITLYGNDLHPNANGYNNMSDAWLIELTDPVIGPVILEKCP